MADLLVVDDEARVLASFDKMLTNQGHRVRTAATAEAALDAVQQELPELVIMDIHLPDMSGLDAFQIIHKNHPRLPVIIMTAFGTTDTAIEATKMGAFDYQLKPFDPDHLLATIERALECRRLTERGVQLNAESPLTDEDAIIGTCPPMQEVYKAVGRVAATDATVLIRGETGTGKELVARAIYQHSQRKEAPLVMINCAAIPETLLEAELFGHEKGSFTGAHARRIGKFEQARGGTIFLDEIGDMPPSIQAKILRVLQEKHIERVGGNERIPVDVRIFAATNTNLEKTIAEGGFRDDLYHRLNVWSIIVPPLRERREDIPKLVTYFLHRFAREHNQEAPPLSKEALQMLINHPWPGNVRELEHCINRALIYTCGYPIRGDDIKYVLKLGREPESTVALQNRQEKLQILVEGYLKGHSGEDTHTNLMEQVDKMLVATALKMTGGNKTQASRILGVSRPTLQAKLQKYGVT